MSNPSKQDAKKKEKEACTSIDEEDCNMFLTGKNPFFDVVITKSNIEPSYIMFLPVSIASVLSRATIPTVLTYSGKNWNISYRGDANRPIFRPGWKRFAVENHLKVGDACIFELMENMGTNLRFKVIILRNEELPLKFQANESSDKLVIEID